MKKIEFRIVAIVCIILLPLWALLLWFCWPKKQMTVAIIDKTVITPKGQEHNSLNWILTQEKYVQRNNHLYQTDRDYFGFFPADSGKFRIKGLERFTDIQLDQLSRDCDAVYLTDAYGVYKNEWYKHKNIAERSGIIYGGMSAKDVSFLKKMKERHKLIITEFNCLGSPTTDNNRLDFENSFHIKWTGWIGRYFHSLDTTANRELPRWLVRNYVQQYGKTWNFKKSGIALVNTTDQVVILEKDTHLNQELPVIYATKEGREVYNLPSKINYSYWFDIVQTKQVNQIISEYKIYTNNIGKTALLEANIPSSFPAVIKHAEKDYQFYYFCGDFCDNPIGNITAYFKFSDWVRKFISDRSSEGDREGFFWKFYRPLVTKILKDYYSSH